MQKSTLFPSPTLFRSDQPGPPDLAAARGGGAASGPPDRSGSDDVLASALGTARHGRRGYDRRRRSRCVVARLASLVRAAGDRKSTRLNSSHVESSYAV